MQKVAAKLKPQKQRGIQMATNLQAYADKTAIALSLMCAIHCLALPVLVATLPVLTSLNLTDEAFHTWLLYGVIPTSIIALFLGCKKHCQFKVGILGSIGLIILIASATFVSDLFGETGEKAFTLLGATLIAASHFTNHRLCKIKACSCS